MEQANPDIQLISNVVLQDDQGRILFVKYDPDDERWYLPGDDLAPYQHPDERAWEVLEIEGVTSDAPRLVFVESFRGRRGWHVMFNYSAKGGGAPSSPNASWFPADRLPRTMHGKWEREVVRRVLETVGAVSA